MVRLEWLIPGAFRKHRNLQNPEQGAPNLYLQPVCLRAGRTEVQTGTDFNGLTACWN